MSHILTLHKQDKPREKLLAKGAQALKDYELLRFYLAVVHREKV